MNRPLTLFFTNKITKSSVKNVSCVFIGGECDVLLHEIWRAHSIMLRKSCWTWFLPTIFIEKSGTGTTYQHIFTSTVTITSQLKKLLKKKGVQHYYVVEERNKLKPAYLKNQVRMDRLHVCNPDKRLKMITLFLCFPQRDDFFRIRVVVRSEVWFFVCRNVWQVNGTINKWSL